MAIDYYKYQVPLSYKMLEFLKQEEKKLLERRVAITGALETLDKELAEVREQMIKIEDQANVDNIRINKEHGLVINEDTTTGSYPTTGAWFDRIAYILKEVAAPMLTSEIVEMIMKRENIIDAKRRAVVKRVSDVLTRDDRIQRTGKTSKTYRYSLK